ncbi:MAG TPA: hypothetical protein VGN42_20705 [Pirellulales bacterium]|nr:hypothetical protein [Pirellulales bacterium]
MILFVAYITVDAVLPVLLDRWIKHWSAFSDDPDASYFLDYLWIWLICGQWGMLSIWLVFGTSLWPVRLIVSLGGATFLTAVAFASDMAIRGEIEISGLRETLSIPLFTLAATAPLWAMWLWRGWRMTNHASPAKTAQPGVRGLFWATAIVAVTVAIARFGVADVVPEQQASAVVIIAFMGIWVGVLLYLPSFCAVFASKRPVLGLLAIGLYSLALAAAHASAFEFAAEADDKKPFAIYLATCVALDVGLMLWLAGSLLVMRWTGWTLCRPMQNRAAI